MDTDVLGTFTSEVPCPGPPLGTVIATVRLGMAVPMLVSTWRRRAPLPFSTPPFSHCDRELVVLVDDEHGLVAWESHVS